MVYRISDALWCRMKSWFPRVRRYRKGGRPVVPFQPVMVEIFYVLRSGCPWKAAPNGFGSDCTLHRRLQQWARCGVNRGLWRESVLTRDRYVFESRCRTHTIQNGESVHVRHHNVQDDEIGD